MATFFAARTTAGADAVTLTPAVGEPRTVIAGLDRRNGGRRFRQ
jgi:hypothetical protein